MIRRRLALAAVLAVVVACGGDDDGPSASELGAASTSTSSTASTSAPGPPEGTTTSSIGGSTPSTTPVESTAPANDDVRSGSVTITEQDDGRMFTVTTDSVVRVRLDSDWTWTSLASSGPATATEVLYESDPGYVEWEVRFDGRGTVTLTSAGTCAADGCSGDIDFDVTVDVTTG